MSRLQAFALTAALLAGVAPAAADEPIAVEPSAAEPLSEAPSAAEALPAEPSAEADASVGAPLVVDEAPHAWSSHVTVPAPPREALTPSPDASADLGGRWYGHWTLLAGMVSGGLYGLAVYGTTSLDGDEQIGAGIGSGYLLLGSALASATLHGLHDNTALGVVSGITRLVAGVAAPAIVSAVCSDGASCHAWMGVASAAATMAPVAIEAALSWE